ncbi:MAG: hypothetical protein MJ207_00315 [Bacilli bacterium]|nr:hypothetical protein [Bacilli bacterium]
MLEFLKRFGLGILYIIISPFLVAFLALWLAYNIITYFIEVIRGIKHFFKGEKFFAPFPEEVQAKAILNTYTATGATTKETPAEQTAPAATSTPEVAPAVNPTPGDNQHV